MREREREREGERERERERERRIFGVIATPRKFVELCCRRI